MFKELADGIDAHAENSKGNELSYLFSSTYHYRSFNFKWDGDV